MIILALSSLPELLNTVYKIFRTWALLPLNLISGHPISSLTDSPRCREPVTEAGPEVNLWWKTSILHSKLVSIFQNSPKYYFFMLTIASI
jgi:hypothetical protein